MVIWDVLAMRPEAARHARVAADDVRSGNWKHTLRIALCDVFANSWGALNKSHSSFAHPVRCTFLISLLGRCRAGWWSRPHRLFLSGRVSIWRAGWGYRCFLQPSINTLDRMDLTIRTLLTAPHSDYSSSTSSSCQFLFLPSRSRR
jgi:hypothetical protein